MSTNILTGSKSPAFLLGAAAAGFVVGLAANFGRNAVVQGITAAQGEWDDGLKAEHRLTLRLFDAIEKTDATQTWKRGMLLTQLKHALGKHAFEEENVVYPAMRDHGQVEDADQLVHDHGYVKQYLHDLTTLARSRTTIPRGSSRSGNSVPISRRISSRRKRSFSRVCAPRSAPKATGMSPPR